jgi:hypothetical protein
MEIFEEEYEAIVSLLRDGDRHAAFQCLRGLAREEEDVVISYYLDQIAEDEAIPSIGNGNLPRPSAFTGIPAFPDKRRPSTAPSSVSAHDGPNWVIDFLRAVVPVALVGGLVGWMLIPSKISPYNSDRYAVANSLPDFLTS